LVNYENAIPENYEPKLVEVPGGEKVDERIYDPLMEMLEAAKEGNWDQLPMVVSGYRTQETQQQFFDDKVAEYRKEGNSQREAEELAKQWVSLPGYSEHQIGLAVDINGATYDLYFWLQENSYKYGFIFRYPGDKTDSTGVAEEVWHYRYVGVEAATEMYEKGLCLEEYLAERQAEQ
jgi:D-alanyl-D-alanine carboxypeptidase